MKLQIIQPAAAFDCPRSCPNFERVDRCRFNAIFAALGCRQSVNSHTVSVDVRFESAEALTAAVEALGGSVIGFGSHKLFQNGGASVDGFGFQLPGWKFPLVATSGGQLSYDDFEGRWGNVDDIATLTAEYSFQAAKTAADSVGWLTERVDVNGAAALRVFHPAGGYLDVGAAGSVEAFGFNGVGCHAAASELAAAMGEITAEQPKAEFYNQQNQNQQLG